MVWSPHHYLDYGEHILAQMSVLRTGGTKGSELSPLSKGQGKTGMHYPGSVIALSHCRITGDILRILENHQSIS